VLQAVRAEVEADLRVAAADDAPPRWSKPVAAALFCRSTFRSAGVDARALSDARGAPRVYPRGPAG